MLFEPLEKQLNLPAVMVQFCNLQCGQIKVIGQKKKLTFVLCIPISDKSQRLRIISLLIVTYKLYCAV